MNKNKEYDVVIVGGSYAGLAAAMTLGRAIRNVLVIDSGKPCNASAPHSHNFLTQDGVEPGVIRSIAKSQVIAYPTVEFIDDLVENVTGEDYNFSVTTQSGQEFRSKKMIFSTGIKDTLPEIKGFSDSWGKSIIHCPYCHGYEYKGQRTGVIANGEVAFEFTRMIRNWTDKLIVFTNGISVISDEHKAELEKMGISINESLITEVVHDKGYVQKIINKNGEEFALDVLYAPRLPFKHHSPIPEQLGCKLTEYGLLEVDAFQKTAVKGLYAAGDNSIMFRAVASSVAAGTLAGAMVNHELIAEKKWN